MMESFHQSEKDNSHLHLLVHIMYKEMEQVLHHHLKHSIDHEVPQACAWYHRPCCLVSCFRKIAPDDACALL
jgi:hypothetical protein